MSTSGRRAGASSRATRRMRRSTPSDTISRQLESLLAKLKGYQRTSVEHLLRQPFAGLLLDPGLGKTLCVLVAFWLLRRLGYVDWLLVVAPLRPCYQVWPKEIEKWGLPFKSVVLHGSDKDAILDDALSAEATPTDVFIINYDGLAWLHPHLERLTKRGTGWLVVDEMHKVKNAQSLRHRTLETMLDCFGRRTGLTGTVMPQGYIDLMGQMKVLDKGARLGWHVGVYRRWFNQIDAETGEVYHKAMGPPPKYLRWVPTKDGMKEIQRRTSDVLLQFSDTDLGLPPYRTHVIEVELPPDARTIYDALERDFLTAVDLEGVQKIMLSASNSGVLGQKLRQVCNGGVYDDLRQVVHLHHEKAQAVADYWEELHQRPLLVAFEFGHDRERLKKTLGDPPSIDGQTHIKEAVRLMERLNAGKESLLLVQESVMEGVNLQDACHDVIWHSLTWNAANYVQLIKRVHRLGQKHHVTVAHVVAKNTRDARVMSACRQKVVTQQRFLQAIRSYQDG